MPYPWSTLTDGGLLLLLQCQTPRFSQARVADGIRGWASERRSRYIPSRSLRGNSRSAMREWIQLDSSPTRLFNSTLHQSSHGFATRVYSFCTKTKALVREIPPATQAIFSRETTIYNRLISGYAQLWTDIPAADIPALLNDMNTVKHGILELTTSQSEYYCQGYCPGYCRQKRRDFISIMASVTINTFKKGFSGPRTYKITTDRAKKTLSLEFTILDSTHQEKAFRARGLDHDTYNIWPNKNSIKLLEEHLTSRTNVRNLCDTRRNQILRWIAHLKKK